MFNIKTNIHILCQRYSQDSVLLMWYVNSL